MDNIQQQRKNGRTRTGSPYVPGISRQELAGIPEQEPTEPNHFSAHQGGQTSGAGSGICGSGNSTSPEPGVTYWVFGEKKDCNRDRLTAIRLGRFWS
jgi:hypothetical protein